MTQIFLYESTVKISRQTKMLLRKKGIIPIEVKHINDAKILVCSEIPKVILDDMMKAALRSIANCDIENPSKYFVQQLVGVKP